MASAIIDDDLGSSAPVAPGLIAVAALHAQVLLRVPGDAGSVPVANLYVIGVPSILAALLLSRCLTLASIGHVVAMATIELAALWAASIGGWVDETTLADPSARVALAVLPALLAQSRMPSSSRRFGSRLRIATIVGGLSAAAAFAVLTPTRRIDQIVFDEAHGPWESTAIEPDGNQFGRSSLYTYWQLFDLAERVAGSASRLSREALPADREGALLIVKTPVKAFSPDYVQRFETWLGAGGRALFVLDHTDLFDMAQLTNPVLKRVADLSIAADAVIDARGLPVTHGAPLGGRLRARVDAAPRPLRYQTGASFAELPWFSTTLATFGPSYAEPANYATENRFGPFRASSTYRFKNHPSVVAVPVGSGLVLVLTDSTFWSNFSLAHSGYKALFLEIVRAAEHDSALRLLPWMSLLLLAGSFLSICSRSRAATAITVLLSSAYFGTGISVVRQPIDPMSAPADAFIGVGTNGGVELLPQLVPVGGENYARVIASLVRARAMATAIPLNGQPPNLLTGTNWSLIAPTPQELPSPRAVQDFVQGGGRLNVLLSENSTSDDLAHEWLDGLGMRLDVRRLLAFSEDANPRLLERSGTLPFRRRLAVVSANRNSNWRSSRAPSDIEFVTQFTLDQSTGSFTVGFSAERFADAEIGDIWEGSEPSFLARLREQQFVRLVGVPSPPGANADVPIPRPRREMRSRFRRFAVFSDSALVADGRMDGGAANDADQELRAYLLDLEAAAIERASEVCLPDAALCNAALVTPDLIEWRMKLERVENRSILELLHIESFSGMAGTYNIVFSNE
ncbi:MAG: hypothetical protein FJ033_16135 [Chloroflexi bacterium]|nr:hypothetical protein [Chloroflexota bacterium]